MTADFLYSRKLLCNISAIQKNASRGIDQMHKEYDIRL
jgi:hypothetical protein